MAAHRELGRDRYGWGYGGTGKKSHNNEFLDYGEKFNDGDVIGCHIDHCSGSSGGKGSSNIGSISYAKNGKSLGKAFDIPVELQVSMV